MGQSCQKFVIDSLCLVISLIWSHRVTRSMFASLMAIANTHSLQIHRRASNFPQNKPYGELTWYYILYVLVINWCYLNYFVTFILHSTIFPPEIPQSTKVCVSDFGSSTTYQFLMNCVFLYVVCSCFIGLLSLLQWQFDKHAITSVTDSPFS